MKYIVEPISIECSSACLLNASLVGVGASFCGGYACALNYCQADVCYAATCAVDN